MVLSHHPEVIALLVDGELPKDDVLATARIAGIMAAKRTGSLIPLCHQLSLSSVDVEFTIDTGHRGHRDGLDVRADRRRDGALSPGGRGQSHPAT